MTVIRSPRVRNCALMLGALLGATIVTACAGTANGGGYGAQQTYYISPSGSDAAAGTSPANAWQTLHKASSVPLPPGSKILLQGGRRFTGSLIVGAWDTGTPTAPITIGTYGAGPATLFAPSGDGIFVHDASGVDIENINLIGTPGPGDGDGINVYNDLPADHRLNHIDITNVDATGFMIGIAVSGRNNGAGFADVRITNSSVHGNINAGLATFGPPFNPQAPTYANSNVVVSHVVAMDNLGNPLDKTQNTGNGIVLGSVQGATVNWSVAAKNGGAGASVQGPAGIWTYDSTEVDIEHDLSYANKTRDRSDGNGFGLDQNTSHSTIQYDLSYGNDGSGFLIYSSLGDGAQRYNTVRDNISSYDVRDGNSFYGALGIIGHVANVTVYQNTAVMEPAATGSPPILRLSADLKYVIIANNIFTTESGPIVATAAPLPESSVELKDNDYYSVLSSWQVIWGTTTYGSLAAWQSGTGQETANGQPTGFAVAPQLTEPVFGLSTSSPGDSAAARGFELGAGSPLIGAGLAPASLGLESTPNYLGQLQSPQHPNLGAM
jgi:hypothetical protein